MKEILIAGGGIGGLAAALALARKGRKVRVLEKAAEFGEIGYGIQMGPNVSRMLERLEYAQVLQHARDIRPHLDAVADFAEFRGFFQHAHLAALLRERQRDREAADATA